MWRTSSTIPPQKKGGQKTLHLELPLLPSFSLRQHPTLKDRKRPAGSDRKPRTQDSRLPKMQQHTSSCFLLLHLNLQNRHHCQFAQVTGTSFLNILKNSLRSRPHWILNSAHCLHLINSSPPPRQFATFCQLYCFCPGCTHVLWLY